MAARYDVIVVGAGISGMYQLHRLRGLGLSVRVFEAGDGVGGTWYWNRYPGARFDSESWTYGYSFSEEILREWEWSEHFAAQPETLRYCNFVADKLDLRRDIEFGCRIKAAIYDDATGEWEIESEDGRRARSQFLITAIGPLSAPTMPTIPGVESFRGEAYHTGRWPHEPVSFVAKRVTVIGTGATRFRRSPRSPRRSATSPCSSARRTGARRFTTARSMRPPRLASRRRIRRSLRAAASRSAASSTTPIRARPSRWAPRSARPSSRSSTASPGSASGWVTSATC